MSATPADASGERAPGRKPRQKVHKETAKKKRRGSGARPPGSPGGAVLKDEPVKRPYVPHAPRFPMTREQVVATCLAEHSTVQVAGEALALMDLMTRDLCTMHHLHVISGVGYATIHGLLTLKLVFNTPLRVHLAKALHSTSLELESLAYLNLEALGLRDVK